MKRSVHSLFLIFAKINFSKVGNLFLVFPEKLVFKTVPQKARTVYGAKHVLCFLEKRKATIEIKICIK